MIALPSFDLSLAQAMESGNPRATAFAIQLLQLYLIDERQTIHVTESDLYHSIESLARMTIHRAPPDG